MLDTLYKNSDGKKTILGFVSAFIVGGLLYTKVIDEELAKILILLSGAIVSFGLGGKWTKRSISK